MSASRYRLDSGGGKWTDDHGFQTHVRGCDGSKGPSGCKCWTDLVTAEHLTDGRACWCHPQVIEVLGTINRIVVHRRLEC